MHAKKLALVDSILFSRHFWINALNVGVSIKSWPGGLFNSSHGYYVYTGISSMCVVCYEVAMGAASYPGLPNILVFR